MSEFEAQLEFLEKERQADLAGTLSPEELEAREAMVAEYHLTS
jgi:hypothetical protein